MKVWLNGRRRDFRLTPAARTAGWIVIALIYLSIFLSPLISGQRLNVWSWVTVVIAVSLLIASVITLLRQLRGGDRIQILATVI